MPNLLVVEDDSSLRNTIVTCLELEGYAVEAVSSTFEAVTRLEQQSYPIVISDIYLDERTGIDVLRAARRRNPECAVILMSGRGSMETVMAATEGGAFEYLAKPFDMSQMVETIKRAEKSLEAVGGDDEADPIDDLPETEMIGSSPRMIEIYTTISKVAPTDATVLIEGETGTGKELIARMLHRNSRRSTQAFVPVDCGAIAPSLLESELFGTLKGAYILRKETAPLTHILIGTGSELSLALAAGEELGAGVRVVSMPSMEVFARQPKPYQEEVLPAACTKRVSIEAGVTLSWGRHVGTAGKAIGTDTFGLSAPGDVVMKELGITKEAVVAAAKAL